MGAAGGGAAASWAVPAGIAAVSALSSGKGGGSSQASTPYGFRRASNPMGEMIRGVLYDPRFAGGEVSAGGTGGLNKGGGRGGTGTPIQGGALGSALDFYAGLPTNPDIETAAGAYRQTAADPTAQTDPLFNLQRERLGAQLTEESRRRGGLFSTTSGDMVSQGLSDFYARYLADASQRRLAGAEGLGNLTFQRGQAQWDPFRFLASAIPGLGGASVIPPAQYNNQKAQGTSTAGNILGNINWPGSSGGGGDTHHTQY